MSSARSNGCDLYYEEAGEGVVGTYGHAAPFDATTNFVRLIADTITSRHGDVALPTRV